MTTVGNIGIGLLILIIIWIIALIIFVFAVKLQSNLGWVALFAATILTITLVVIPTDSPEKDSTDNLNLDKDYGIVYRTVLLIFLILTAFVACISFFIIYCIEPIRPKPVKSFYVK